MIWTKVSYENIGLLSKGETSISKHLYITGDNFTGKTTFLELLPLLLYNKLPIKKLSLQDAITWNEEGGFVKGTILHNDKEYDIHREADTSGKRVKQIARVYKDGKLLNPDESVAAATQIISKEIIPFNMFMTAIYMASTGSFTAFDLVYMENSKRKDVLSELVPRPQDWIKLEEKFSTAAREKADVSTISDDLYEQLERTIYDIEETAKEREDAEKHDNETRKKIETIRRYLLSSRREAEAIISKGENFIDKFGFEGWNRKLDIGKLMEVSDEYERTEQRIEEVGKVGKEPYKPTKHGEICESCDLYKESHDNYICWKERKERLEKLEQKISRLEKHYVPTEELERYEELLERDRNIRIMQSSVEIYNGAISQIEDALSKEPEYSSSLAVAEKMGKLIKEREMLKERISQEEEKTIIAKYKEEYAAACSVLATAFGNRGIILSNLEEILYNIGKKSSDLCAQILDEHIVLEWIIRPRGNRDDIDLLVSGKPVETKSGAEQKIVRLSTRIALCEELGFDMILNDEMPENLSMDKVKALGDTTSKKDVQIIGTGSKTEIPNYTTLVLKGGIIQ